MSTLISCLTWIPQGKAKETPLRKEFSPDEEAKLNQLQEGLVEEGNGNMDQEMADGDSNMDDGSLSDEEDYIIKETDYLVIVGSSGEETEQHSVELQVFDSEEQSIYVHHDFPVPDFPLCLEWLDFDPRAKGASSGSFVAVGAMTNPAIEIWNMDVIDVLEPVAILGGIKNPERYGEESEERRGEEGVEYEIEFVPDSHQDSVLALSWNKVQKNYILSASADSTVKLWDLNELKCSQTYKIHSDKVTAVAWNPVEASVAVSGGFDRKLCIFNVSDRNNTAPLSTMIPEGQEIESVCWNPHNPAIVSVSTEQGLVLFYDVRKLATNAAPLAAFQPHQGPVSSVSFNPCVPNVIATSSHDGHIKIWDLEGSEIRLIADRHMRVGPLFAMSYHPNSNYVLAGAGGEGSVAIWDTSENSAVETRCAV